MGEKKSLCKERSYTEIAESFKERKRKMNIRASEVEIGMTIRSLCNVPYKVTEIDRLLDGSIIFRDTVGKLHFVEYSKMVEWID